MGKRLGQHFLISRSVAEKIVTAAHIAAADVVLEVGPGKGILTELLIQKANHVIAVEKDKELVSFLRENYAGAKNLEVVEGDILKPETWNRKHGTKNRGVLKHSGFKFHASCFKIVANLPYYITSRFLRLFLEEIENKPQSMVLMVQKEVAERIIARPPGMNLLGLSVQVFSNPKILFAVRKGSFSPPPEVDSAVIELCGISEKFFRRYHISPQEFFKLPKKAFSQKRKMLRSSIGIPHPVFGAKRPQELSPEDWVQIGMDHGTHST